MFNDTTSCCSVWKQEIIGNRYARFGIRTITNHNICDIEPWLSDTEQRNITNVKNHDRSVQRAYAYYLIKKILGGDPKKNTIRYRPSGKPYIEGMDVDISIAHTMDVVHVGIIDTPFTLGVDVEHVAQDINTNAFIRYALHHSEIPLVHLLAHKEHLSLTAAMLVFWTVKESFSKCCQYPLIPYNIRIADISDLSNITVRYTPTVAHYLANEYVCIEKIRVEYTEHFIFARTIMKQMPRGR